MSDMGNPRVNQPKSAQEPAGTAKIAGFDYCFPMGDDDESYPCDLDTPYAVEDSPGYASRER